jgi:chemosensory pili system protein ChpA (sensor histidine kinase/response regulator)
VDTAICAQSAPRLQWVLRAVVALLIAWSPRALLAQTGDPSVLAERAVTARYAAEKLNYEKLQAERTVKAAETNIQQSEKSLPQLRMTVEKAEQEKAAAQDSLAQQTAAVAQAKELAAASGNDQDKAAAAKAEQQRLAAEQLLRQKDAAYQRELGSLQRTEDRV